MLEADVVKKIKLQKIPQNWWGWEKSNPFMYTFLLKYECANFDSCGLGPKFFSTCQQDGLIV